MSQATAHESSSAMTKSSLVRTLRPPRVGVVDRSASMLDRNCDQVADRYAMASSPGRLAMAGGAEVTPAQQPHVLPTLAHPPAPPQPHPHGGMALIVPPQR